MKYKCPKCGSVFEGPVKFCPSCGQELKISAPVEEKKEEPKKKYKCPKCGTIFEGKIKFCPGCGSEIKFKEEKKPEPEEEIVTGTEKKPIKKYKCPTCGTLHDKPVEFCSECGAELTFGYEPREEAVVKEEVSVEEISLVEKPKPVFVRPAPKVEEIEEDEPEFDKDTFVDDSPKAQLIDESLPEDDGDCFVEPAVTHTAAPLERPALQTTKEIILPNEDHKPRGVGLCVIALLFSIPSLLVGIFVFAYVLLGILAKTVPTFVTPEFLNPVLSFVDSIFEIGQYAFIIGGLVISILVIIFSSIGKKRQNGSNLGKAASGFSAAEFVFYVLATVAIITLVVLEIVIK